MKQKFKIKELLSYWIKMPHLPWTKKYKLTSSSKKWTIRKTVSFLIFLFLFPFWRIFHVSTQQARTLAEANKKKKKNRKLVLWKWWCSLSALIKWQKKRRRKIGVAIRLKRLEDSKAEYKADTYYLHLLDREKNHSFLQQKSLLPVIRKVSRYLPESENRVSTPNENENL